MNTNTKTNIYTYININTPGNTSGRALLTPRATYMNNNKYGEVAKKCRGEVPRTFLA